MTHERVVTRIAEPGDAAALAAIYKRIYIAPESGGAGNYPYPQFFDPLRIEELIETRDLVWAVSVGPNGSVVGALAARPRVGLVAEDKIADFAGLIVDRNFRNQRRGVHMLNCLWRYLSKETEQTLVALGETRTNNPGATYTLRYANWFPVGFEPLAHLMPQGFEPMVSTAKIAEKVFVRRRVPENIGEISNRLYRGLRWNDALTRRLPENLNQIDRGSIENVLLDLGGDQECEGAWDRKVLSPKTEMLVRRLNIARVNSDNRLELSIKRRKLESENYLNILRGIGVSRYSGVVVLNHLRGESGGNRFEMEDIQFSFNGKKFGSVGLDLDRLDGRLKIAYILSAYPIMHALMMRRVFQYVKEKFCDSNRRHFVIDICIYADDVNFQYILEDMGFFPTAYFPGLVDQEHERVDCVQYTRILGVVDLNYEKLIDSLSGWWSPAWHVGKEVVSAMAKAGVKQQA